MNPIKKLLGIFKRDKYKVLTDINPDVEDNIIIKEQSKKIQALEGQLSKIVADKKLKEVKKLDEEAEINLIKELREGAINIKKKKYGDYFLLSSFFKKTKLGKIKNREIELSDRNDFKVFDYFKDFVILNNGHLGILGESGEIWSEGETIDNIIFKPETLGNQLRRKRILLPYDKDFNFIPDLEKIKVPEISYDEKEDKWSVSEERIQPFINLLIERDKKIFNLKKEKEHHEQVMTDLRNSIKDEQLAKESWKIQAESIKSQLSIAIENERQITNIVGSLNRDFITAQEQKEISDNLKEKYSEALNKIIEELEEEKSQTTERRKKDELQRDMEWMIKKMPKQEVVMQSEETTKRPLINPGTKI